MNFKFYYEKLEDSGEYKNFMKKNPKAYPCSCLFILDREKDGRENKVHFDFWLPDEKKMVSFRVDGKIEHMGVENFDTRLFEEISVDYGFEIEEFEKLILKEMEKEKVKGKLNKLLFSLQKLKGKEFFIVTGFLNNFGLIKVTISLAENKIISFEKKSLLDMMKIIKGNRGKDEKKD